MINVDKILGGIVQSVVSSALSPVVSKGTARRTGAKLGRTVSRMDKRAIGIGALGIAVAAYEHYKGGASNSNEAAPASAPNPFSSQGAGAVPPPPPPGSPDDSEQFTLGGSPDALILLRTMVAAASTDGIVDDEERRNILGALADVGLTPEEHQFVDQEFRKPHPIESVVSGVQNRELAEQVFTVANLAINVDQASEQRFMAKLQGLLRLDDATADRIAQSVR